MKNIRRNAKETDRDTDNTEEKQRKVASKKTSIWKNDITFLNFLINITFTIHAIFQILVLITLPIPQTLSDARSMFFKLWLAVAIFELLSFVLDAKSLSSLNLK